MDVLDSQAAQADRYQSARLPEPDGFSLSSIVDATSR